ncbi:MAG TPA: potassium channel family protein [Pyrinomonadaceae bacterium]|jgi:hypothetical protein
MTTQPHTGTPPKANPVASESASTVYSYAVSGFIVYMIALIGSWYFNKTEVGWIVVLLAIPAVAPIIGVHFHLKRADKRDNNDQIFYNFSMKVSFYCTAGYCILWVLYSGLYSMVWLRSYSHLIFSWVASIFSWAALAGIALLISLIGYMTCAFLHEMKADLWPKLFAIRTGAAKEPLWALSFLFFVIFLDVTYLFGFALAFHDQSCLSINDSVPALHMANLVSPDDISSESNSSQDKSTGSTGVAQIKATSNSTSTEDTNFFFYFDVRRARLEKNSKAECEPIPDKKDARRAIPPQRVNWILKSLNDFNSCSLEAITRRISQESKGGNRTRVILIGRSNDDPIKDEVKNGLNREVGRIRSNDELVDYKSNYELSEARAENVRFAIVEALKVQDGDTEAWHNLEWLSLPSSNETPIEADEVLQRILTGRSLDDNQKKDLIDKNKRVVIASVVSIPGDITSIQMKHEQPKHLSLMDYMYFSIYTITTTGYGDIIPTTAYSKFVISLANVCEVLFLVVFFNALISLKSKPQTEVN